MAELTPEELAIFDTKKKTLTDTATSKQDEAIRQYQLAQKAVDEKAQQDINNSRIIGAVGGENQRIIDTVKGSAGGGAAVQHILDINNRTGSTIGQIQNALTTARAESENQIAGVKNAYDAEIKSIENQIAEAIANAKVEKAAALIKQQQELIAAQNKATSTSTAKVDTLSPSLLSKSALQQYGTKDYNEYNQVVLSIPEDKKTEAYNYLYNEAVSKGYSQADFEEALIRAGLSGYNPQVAEQQQNEQANAAAHQATAEGINKQVSDTVGAGKFQWFGSGRAEKVAKAEQILANAVMSGLISEAEADQIAKNNGI